MKRSVWRTVLVAAGLCLAACSLRAAEPVHEFLDGMRSRQYFDWAMLYLEQLQDQPNLPAELRAILPYERAMTLAESAKHSVSPNTQQRQLDQALGFLEQFTKESPQHPLAATANSTRAGLLLSKARVDILQSKLPANKDGRSEHQERARVQIQAARKVFETAHEQYKAKWETFPKFIDKVEESAKWEARSHAEVAYMRAQLDLALCEFEEAQTHDKGTANNSFHLKNANEGFHAIFTKYRATVGGLHAQMWQAKCYEEMDDPQRALGIYAELLGHPPEGLKALQDQVRHFRMICLNHDQRREYAMAIVEADEWLTKARPIDQRSQAGQGIRWELVVAQEKLADSAQTTAAEKDKLLRFAVSHLKTLARTPGPYRELATQRIRELSLRQRGKDGSDDPKDFDSALALGRDLVKRVGEKKALVDSAGHDKRPRDESEQLKADFQSLLKEHIRVFRLTLRLANGATPKADVKQARYLLAYGYYLADKPYEAAIAAESVAFDVAKDKQDEQTALDAAYLALAAYIKGINQIPADLKPLRDVDVKLMMRLATHITAKWPSHPKANESRQLMGRTLQQMDRALEASEWFLKVPEAAENFPEAQAAAGQALWQHYLMSSLTDDLSLRATPDELSRWRADAEKYLRAGVERTQKKLPEAGQTPDELVAAKVALAEVLLSAGDYSSAIELLEKLPHSVLVAIHVDDQQRRPQHPSVRSARFASHVYQLLLRGRVGLQQLDAAREVMSNLEKLAEHSGGADAVTAVYVQLGRELEKELNRLKAAGDKKRFDEVRRSFEDFLDAMFKRPDQNYSSLTWIAETYFGLGQSTLDQQAISTKYFERAAETYRTILDRAKKEKKFADKDRLAGIRLRLVNCLRRQGDFKTGEEVLTVLLVERPKATDVQFEAAYFWQEQGLTGGSEFFKKAVSGGKLGDKAHVWGWTDLSARLQRQLGDGRQETRERFGDKPYEAWFNTAFCRHKLGLAQATTAKKQAELESAKQVIQTFVGITLDIPADWFKKFDRLYRQIQSDLNQSPEPLERPKDYLQIAAAAKAKSGTKPDKLEVAAAEKMAVAKTKSKEKAAAKRAESSSAWTYTIFGLLVLGGGGWAAWMFVNGKKPPRRIRVASDSDDSPFTLGNPDELAAPVSGIPEFATARPATSAKKKIPLAGKAAAPAAAVRKKDKEPQSRQEK